MLHLCRGICALCQQAAHVRRVAPLSSGDEGCIRVCCVCVRILRAGCCTGAGACFCGARHCAGNELPQMV
jgi:hypothetical protein